MPLIGSGFFVCQNISITVHANLDVIPDVVLFIHNDPHVIPTFQKPHQLPTRMQKQFNTEIDKFFRISVIEPITKLPKFLNPLIVAPKKDLSNGKTCVEMRAVNVAVVREPYQIPTLDDMLQYVTFNGCIKFTKLGLCKGYHQICLTHIPQKNWNCSWAWLSIVQSSYQNLLQSQTPFVSFF